MNSAFPLVGIAFVVVIAFGVFWLYFTNARQILEKWAAGNSYEIQSAEYRWFFRGPFQWRTNDQAVYYVTIRMPNGQVKRGWVCCLSNQPDVRWDD